VVKYDRQGRPVYKNNHLPRLRNDELTVGGLRALAFVGGIGEETPKEIHAALVAHLNNSYGDDRSSLGFLQKESNPEYLQNRNRFSELRRLLKDVTIWPVDDGWIGLKVVDNDGGTKVEAARVVRTSDSITTEVAYFETELWNQDQLQILKMSEEYRRILVWLFDNRFL